MTPPSAHGSAVRRLAALDGLRGVAALLVFGFHLDHNGGLALGPIGANGQNGVVIFFVLSGFLIVRPFLRGDVEPAGYLVRRLARIVPAYVVALLGVTVASGSGAVLADPVPYLLFAQSREGIVLVAWTLQVEVVFYLLVPVLAPLARRLRPRIAIGSLVALAVLSLVAGAVGSGSDLRAAFQFPFLAWAFVPGILVAVAIERGLVVSGRVAALGTALIVGSLVAGIEPTIDLATALGTAYLIGWAVRSGPASLGGRPAIVLGALSYSFYLWHQEIILMLRASGLDGAVLALVALGTTSVVAGAVYLVVEAPLIRAARAWSARRRRDAAGAAPTEAEPLSRGRAGRPSRG